IAAHVTALPVNIQHSRMHLSPFNFLRTYPINTISNSYSETSKSFPKTKTPAEDTAVPRIPGRRHRALTENAITYPIGRDPFRIAASAARIPAYLNTHQRNTGTGQANTF